MRVMLAVRAGEDVGSSAHAAGHQHRLADLAVAGRHHRVMRAEGTRGAFPVHEEPHLLSTHLVGLDLRHVVRDVVNEGEVPVAYPSTQHVLKCFADAVGKHLAVGPGIVGRSVHGSQVVFALARIQGCADQLAVRQLIAEAPAGGLELLDVIRRHLVPQPTAPTVDLDHRLPHTQPENLRRGLIVDPGHLIDFGEVIARAEGTYLVQATLPGALAYLVRIGSGHTAALLRALDVFGLCVAFTQRPLASHGENIVELGLIDVQVTFDADPARQVRVHGVGQPGKMGPNLCGIQM